MSIDEGAVHNQKRGIMRRFDRGFCISVDRYTYLTKCSTLKSIQDVVKRVSSMKQSPFSVGWWMTRHDRELDLLGLHGLIVLFANQLNIISVFVNSNWKYTAPLRLTVITVSCWMSSVFSQRLASVMLLEVEIATWLILPVAYACLKD